MLQVKNITNILIKGKAANHNISSLPAKALDTSVKLIQPQAPKILGVFFDSALAWEKQVSQVIHHCYSVLVGLAKLTHR